MNTHKSSSEKGQSMVMIILMLLAFVAMLALVLDGGLAYASRRKAQNAADAGALAGAAVMCQPDAYTDDPTTVALDYAIAHNGADPDPTLTYVTLDTEDKIVTVDATVTYDTAFAFIFGVDPGHAKATASAACSPVCGSSRVMPIAWSCRAPVTEVEQEESESTACTIKYGPGNLYIIMDSIPYDGDVVCQNEDPTSPIDCDIDDDGFDDIAPGSGARSWLGLRGTYLNPDATFVLAKVIEGYYNPPPLVTRHRWFSADGGLVDKPYEEAKLLEGQTVLVPVFDQFCDKEAETCPPNPLPHEIDVVRTDPNGQLAFHIYDLAAFHITCVVGDPLKDSCPGRTQFVEDNPALFDNKLYADLPADLKLIIGGWTNVNQYRTIEGYFVEGYAEETLACEPGTESSEVGSWTVTLLK